MSRKGSKVSDTTVTSSSNPAATVATGEQCANMPGEFS